MVQVLVSNYYNFFDKQIENSTLIVVIISLCILFVGLFIPDSWKYASASILNTPEQKTVVKIDGQQYEVIFKKL